MKVSCLTATYGRFNLLERAIACFLWQDYENKELIILNNNPVEIKCDLEKVKVFNEYNYPTLGDCRNRLIELADGDYIRTWDDDDLYFPWAISQGLRHVIGYSAFKPFYSYWNPSPGIYELAQNVFEASWTVKADVAKKYAYKPSSGGDEHITLEQGIRQENGFIILNVRPSYVYSWSGPFHRISGSLGSDSIENRTKKWMEKNQDTGEGKPLDPHKHDKFLEELLSLEKTTLSCHWLDKRM